MGLKSMQERGRMQEGMVADITIFDPKTIRDNSTYAKGTHGTIGDLKEAIIKQAEDDTFAPHGNN